MNSLLAAGTVLGGRYSLEREIGRGGMARVYLALDLRQHRRVAVKVLRPEIAAALGPERFLREIHIASRLAHPHILPVHDSARVSGNTGTADMLYYVMPYVEGESLRERLGREPRLPVEEALVITREIADALAYAHEFGVVHRDIKPGNILLLAGHAVVADFGVARAIAAADERVTASGLIVGTPTYMSPEQAADAEVDGRTDIYALGCVAYEMLTGTPPFVDATPREVIARHQTTPPPPIRELRPEVPEAAAAAIERALAKRPEARYADAREFAEALRAPASWERPPEPRSRWRAPVIAAVLALVAAFAGYALLAPGDRGGAPIEVVVLPFEGDTLQPRPGSIQAHQRVAELINWIPGLHATGAADVLPEGRAAADLALSDLLARTRRAGGDYLLTGRVLAGGPGSRVTVDLFEARSGERVLHAVDSAGPGTLDEPIGRIATGMVGAVATRERLQLGAAGAVLAATRALPAIGSMLQAQRSFWSGDLDAAAAQLRAAVAADSSCGLAYHRLSVVHAWRHDYPAALAAAKAGLRRADLGSPRWPQLLRAQRYLALGYGDSAIVTFQSAVLDNRDDVDGWFGLGEALVHYGGFSGVSPQDARPAFERVAALDSAFAPIYYHLVDLAVYAGDREAAETFLRRMHPGHPYRPAKAAQIRVRFGTPAERVAALADLGSADRQAVSEAFLAWAHGAFDLGLADTAAGYLMGPDRVPDDRLRGAQYRLATRAAAGRWAEAVAAWDSVAGSVTFDPWMIQAVLAGYPARERAEPMFAWAAAQMRAGRTPDFTLPPWDELRQGFEALVYRAVVEGDSADAEELLRRIEGAAPADPAEPAPGALAWSLQARLALLAHDTAGAIAALRRAVARIPEAYTANHPLTAVAPQRYLLARLLHARGDSAGAERWRRSFTRSWAVADLFYHPALDTLTSGSSLLPPRSVP